MCPSNKNHKDVIRTYAQEHDVKYTEALRATSSTEFILPSYLTIEAIEAKVGNVKFDATFLFRRNNFGDIINLYSVRSRAVDVPLIQDAARNEVGLPNLPVIQSVAYPESHLTDGTMKLHLSEGRAEVLAVEQPDGVWAAESQNLDSDIGSRWYVQSGDDTVIEAVMAYFIDPSAPVRFR